MSVVRDLGNLPIGTKIDKIVDGIVASTLHTSSLYENYKYILTDEKGNSCSLTIRELMWGNYHIYFQENSAAENEEAAKSIRNYY